ncbi:MAG: hypothetical protein QM749_14000 [Aquabacterium sp.]
MLLGATLALAGCAVHVKHAATVDNLVVDSEHVSFTVSRVDARVVEGADMHSEKPLAARGEYYAIPIGSTAVPSGLPPLISFDTLTWIPEDTYYAGPADLIVNPVKSWLMPYADRHGATNEAVFPSNSKRVFWHRNGLHGYAYADDVSKLLTHIQYDGPRCTIALPADIGFETLTNDVISLVLSNDGQDVAITRRHGDVSDVGIYRGCKKVADRTLRADGRLIGFCAADGDQLYAFQSRNDNVAVLDKTSQVKYVLPRDVLWKTGREVPNWPSVFDCEKKRFFWLGTAAQTGEHAAITLYQYDPVTRQDSALELNLGARMQAR